jgi:hypothetical protein
MTHDNTLAGDYDQYSIVNVVTFDEFKTHALLKHTTKICSMQLK